MTALFTHSAIFDHVFIQRNIRSWSFITCEGVLEKISHKLYVHIVKVTPHPIALETTNILAKNRGEFHHIFYLQSVF